MNDNAAAGVTGQGDPSKEVGEEVGYENALRLRTS